MLHFTIFYYTLFHFTIIYYTLFHFTILYYTILHFTILYYTIYFPSPRCLAVTGWSMERSLILQQHGSNWRWVETLYCIKLYSVETLCCNKLYTVNTDTLLNTTMSSSPRLTFFASRGFFQYFFRIFFFLPYAKTVI